MHRHLSQHNRGPSMRSMSPPPYSSRDHINHGCLARNGTILAFHCVAPRASLDGSVAAAAQQELKELIRPGKAASIIHEKVSV